MTDPSLRSLGDGWFHVGAEGFDPAASELAAFDPASLSRVREWLRNGLRRGRTEWHDHDVLLAFVVPVMDTSRGEVWTRQILVLASPEGVLTVDHAPPGRPPVDPTPVMGRFHASEDRRAGRLVALIMDVVASAFVEIVDRFDSEADELEDLLEDSTPHSRKAADYLRDRLKHFRSDLHGSRRALQPTMEAVRQVVSGLDLKGDELFPSDVERHLRDTLDKLMYVAESFEGVRDEITSLRDYMQARIANDQNEVMKVLTVVAALVLIPTFIVGFFGQNFDGIPGLHGGFWVAVAAMVLIVVVEAAYLWWRGWIGNRGDSRVERAMRSAVGRER